MFTQILVPLDGSPESAVALPIPRSLALATGAGISLVRVIDQAHRLGDTKLTNDIRHDLQRSADELGGTGIRDEVNVREGTAAKEILAEARGQCSDVIVM